MAVGRHAFADLYGVDVSLLGSETALVDACAEILRRAHFHERDRLSLTFPGAGGVSGLFLLTESHLAFHSYPELGYLAVDLFGCGSADPQAALSALADAVGARTPDVHAVRRGLGLAAPTHLAFG